jgi:hypothetical protein
MRGLEVEEREWEAPRTEPSFLLSLEGRDFFPWGWKSGSHGALTLPRSNTQVPGTFIYFLI